MIFLCEEFPGYNDTFHLLDLFSFVFGYELRDDITLNELRALKEIPTQLTDTISQFIYIFNETDILEMKSKNLFQM